MIFELLALGALGRVLAYIRDEEEKAYIEGLNKRIGKTIDWSHFPKEVIAVVDNRYNAPVVVSKCTPVEVVTFNEFIEKQNLKLKYRMIGFAVDKACKNVEENNAYVRQQMEKEKNPQVLATIRKAIRKIAEEDIENQFEQNPFGYECLSSNNERFWISADRV